MKKKPILFQEIFLQRNNLLFIQGLISIQDIDFSVDDLKTPKDAFLSLAHKDFYVKIVTTDENQKQKDFFFQTSPYGDFSLKFPFFSLCKNIDIFVQENNNYIFLKTITPIHLSAPLNLIFCDFDQTLIETKFKKLKELYQALKSSLNSFSTIYSSVELFKSYSNYYSFILSASPYFFHDLISNWLKNQDISPNKILLKDFRKMLSFKEELSFKDFKDQSYYKISKILHIILLYGYPQRLVLIGDSIESDLLIYSIVKKILSFDSDHKILFDEIFSTIKLTIKQKIDLSEKIIELSQWKESPKIKTEIFIRGKIIKKPSDFFLTNPDEIVFYS